MQEISVDNPNQMEFNENILQIRDLSVSFFLPYGTLNAVYNVDFDLPKSKIMGLVGESGSGKTTLVSAILQSVSKPGKIIKGSMIYEGKDILKLNSEDLRKFKWRDIAMVFQAAQNSLNPSLTIGEHFVETYLAHKKDMESEEILAYSSELLLNVLLEPDRVLRAYPHELSGGMKQRVMIAFAQILKPEILLLDEPTTALDVITQDYIFNILHRIHEESGMTMILSTHDIAVVAKLCDNMAVMYGGCIVESGDVFTMFENPKHPYTRLLIKAAPMLVGDLQERVAIPGDPPDLMLERKGCIFYARCPEAMPICAEVQPEMIKNSQGHQVACHRVSKEEF